MSTALTVSTKNPCLLPSIVACAILVGSAACAGATIARGLSIRGTEVAQAEDKIALWAKQSV